MFQFRVKGTGSKSAVSDDAAKVAAMSRSLAVIEFAMDGTILTANENFLSAMGYTLAEIQGRHHSMFLDASQRDSNDYRLFWDSLNRGQFFSAEYKRVAKGGREIWIQASYNPLLDSTGKPFKVVKFASDITAAKMKALDDAGQIAAIERSQAVISFKMDGTILHANELFLKTMGYSLDEIKGRHHSMFATPAYRASADYHNMWDRLNRGEFLQGTFERVGRNGKQVWIQGSYNPIFDGSNKPIKVVKIVSDVTDSVTIASTIDDVVGVVSAAAGEMQGSVETMESSAQSAREGATTVASASTQLSAAIGEISQQISKTQETTSRALTEAKRSTDAVNGLSKSAERIGEVIGLIRDIAEQTNLLALNATIEAARAGEAGKGFAVVAAEVKALATQTANATGDISKQISEIQSATGAVVDANKTINSRIAEINEISASVAAAVEEQSAATNSVATNIREVSDRASEVGQVTGNVQRASRELAQRAEGLRDQVAQFLRKLGVAA